jgi:hypothetical protein
MNKNDTEYRPSGDQLDHFPNGHKEYPGARAHNHHMNEREAWFDWYREQSFTGSSRAFQHETYKEISDHWEEKAPWAIDVRVLRTWCEACQGDVRKERCG